VFERFSQEARDVVVGAQDEARDLRHAHVGVEHMLLGILRLPPEQVTSRVLASLGIEGDDIRGRLRELVAPGQLVAGQMSFTPHAKRVLVRDAVVALLPPPAMAASPRSILRRARRTTVHQFPMEIDLSADARRLLLSAGARALGDGRTLITISDIEEALRRRPEADDPPPQSATG
jgi:ATP-dependent Clp protease ATP-binding subunit ClpA